MKAILLLQLQRLRRQPFLVLSFFGLTLLFVFILVGMNTNNQLTVLTYGDDSLSEEEVVDWLNKLNETDALNFEKVEEEEARQAVEAGDVSLALQLLKDDYRLLITAENDTKTIVQNHVHQVMTEETRLRQLEEQSANNNFRENVEEYMSQPALSIEIASLAGGKQTNAHEERIHGLVGMTLYFSIFTILFSLMNVAEEKKGGTWNRVIVSPIRKWEMYVGHLLYCFIVGYVQIIAVFLLFSFLFNLHLGDNLGMVFLAIGCYVFAIVALGILIVGLVGSSQQLQAVIPIVATGMAMIGGAFWPLEIVSNEIMQVLAKGMPILYGMEALKGVILYDHHFGDIMNSIAILLLFGVSCIGVGINVMERRS